VKKVSRKKCFRTSVKASALDGYNILMQVNPGSVKTISSSVRATGTAQDTGSIQNTSASWRVRDGVVGKY
jgi:hypothetical protein